MRKSSRYALIMTVIIFMALFLATANTYLKITEKKTPGFVEVDLEELPPEPPQPEEPKKEVEQKKPVESNEPVQKEEAPEPKPAPKEVEQPKDDAKKESEDQNSKSKSNWAEKKAEEITSQYTESLEVLADYSMDELQGYDLVNPKGDFLVNQGKEIGDAPSVRNTSSEKGAGGYKEENNDFFNESAKPISQGGDSQLGYFIDGTRRVIDQPVPNYTCASSGYVQLDVTFDQDGIVKTIKVDRSKSTTNDECILTAAKEFGLKAVAQPSGRSRQKGMLWYDFIGMDN